MTAAITIAYRVNQLMLDRGWWVEQLAHAAMDVSIEGFNNFEAALQGLHENAILWGHLGSVLEIITPGAPTHVNPPPVTGI